MWNRKRSFFKNHRNCLPPWQGVYTDNRQYSGYITRLWNWMNSYWMFWIDGLSCDFWRVTFCNFIAFFPFWQKQPFNLSDVLHIRRTIAYLCLNMINFDAVDFSEHRSEEVMFLLMLSVCILLCKMQLLGMMKNWTSNFLIHSQAPISKPLYHIPPYHHLLAIKSQTSMVLKSSFTLVTFFKPFIHSPWNHGVKNIHNSWIKKLFCCYVCFSRVKG